MTINNFHQDYFDNGIRTDFLFYSNAYFENNYASVSGGGLFIQCTDRDIPVKKSLRFDLSNLTFVGNRAEEYGGGLSIDNEQCQFRTKVYVNQSKFLSNAALNTTNLKFKNAAGGGLSMTSKFRNLLLYVFDCDFEENMASGGEDSEGGAVFLEECQYAKFERNRFLGNRANIGGAIHNQIVGYAFKIRKLVTLETGNPGEVNLSEQKNEIYRRLLSIEGN